MRSLLCRLLIIGFFMLLCVLSGASQAVAADRLPATLLILGSPECFNCRLMAPIVNRLREEYEGRVVFANINVKENQDQARAFRLRRTPTLIFYNGQKRQVYRHEGFLGRDGIIQVLEQMLAVDQEANPLKE